jgi:hypothetical protein
MATAARASAAPFEIDTVAKRYAELLDRVLSEVGAAG